MHRFMTLVRNAVPALAIALLAGCAATAPSSPPPLATEEFMVPSREPGIELYVRNKHPANVDRFAPEKIVLFVHGATYPSETAFDLKLDGVSWMEYIAQRGYDVYLVDVRGYGRSTRPPAMEQPATANPPVIRAPNGVVVDGVRYTGAGNPRFDPAKIHVPVLLIKAEWDADTPAYMAQALFPLLVNAPYKRYIEIGEGTHTIIMEKNRMQLFREVQQFLDESSP